MSCCNLRAALRLAVHAAGAPLRSRPGLLLGARSGGGVRLQQLARVRPAFLVRQGLSARPLHVCRAAEDDNAVAQQGSASDSPEAAAPAAEAGGAAAEAAEKPTEKPSPFAALGLHEKIARRLHDLGAERPTAVQSAAVPAVLSGSNTAIQARTGSGKTLAYLLPVLEMCLREERAVLLDGQRRRNDAVLAIVVAPSQELAIQITERILGDGARQYVQQAIGGANINRQARGEHQYRSILCPTSLPAVEGLRKNKPMIVVGSPGRLAELSELGQLRSHGTRMLVLDEADELLDQIFRRSLSRLAEHAGRGVPGGRQTVLVSATLSQKVIDGYSPWCCKEPKTVSVTGPTFPERDLSVPAAPAAGAADGGAPAAGEAASSSASTVPDMPENLTHAFVLVDDSRHRVDQLRRAIYALDSQRALVFLNFGRRLDDTAAKLSARGMPVGALHGELSKGERNAVLTAFRTGRLRALLVTDLAARGLDVPECDAVFNLELPTDGTHYAHRAGRTGRLGRPGIVVSLVEQREAFVISKFEKALKVSISRVETGGGEMRIIEKRPRSAPPPQRRRAPKAEGEEAAAAAGEAAVGKQPAEQRQRRASSSSSTSSAGPASGAGRGAASAPAGEGSAVPGASRRRKEAGAGAGEKPESPFEGRGGWAGTSSSRGPRRSFDGGSPPQRGGGDEREQWSGDSSGGGRGAGAAAAGASSSQRW